MTGAREVSEKTNRHRGKEATIRYMRVIDLTCLFKKWTSTQRATRAPYRTFRCL